MNKHTRCLVCGMFVGGEYDVEGIEEEDEVPIVDGVLMGAFAGVGELGLLEGVVVEEEDVMDERRLRRMRMV
ncbi:hypothetical protein Tco_1161588 [Tanacetum coccineum]